MSLIKKLKKEADKSGITQVVQDPVQAVQDVITQPQQAAQNPAVNPYAASKDLGPTIVREGNKAIGDIKKGDVRLPTPGEMAGRKGAPGWNPSQTWQEWGKKIGGDWFPTMGDIYGANPKVREDGIFKDTGTGAGGGGPGGMGSAEYNPYGAPAKTLAESELGPDFGAATKSGAFQQSLAQKLAGSGGFYDTGAGAISSLIKNLQGQSLGDFGPRTSLAQAMLQQGLNQNIAGVRSQLASQRGLSPALAARYAAQQTAQLGGQTAQQAGILGLQQQIAAQEQLGRLGMGAAELGAGVGGQLVTKAREADITQAAAKSDADLKKLNILAQSDVQLKELAARTGIDEAKIKTTIALANQAAAQGDRQMQTQIIGALISALGEVGASAVKPTPVYSGGRINGLALKSGDHPKNDTVPAMLSPGEIVIPRSAAKDKKKAKAFLDALDGWDEKPSYAKVLKARRGR